MKTPIQDSIYLYLYILDIQEIKIFIKSYNLTSFFLFQVMLPNSVSKMVLGTAIQKEMNTATIRPAGKVRYEKINEVRRVSDYFG